MVRDKVKKLQNLGRLSDDVMDEFIDLLGEIERPTNIEEVEILIKLFPDFMVDGAGVDWALLHLIESLKIDLELYEKLADLCPSEEWKSMILKRIQNSKD